MDNNKCCSCDLLICNNQLENYFVCSLCYKKIHLECYVLEIYNTNYLKSFSFKDFNESIEDNSNNNLIIHNNYENNDNKIFKFLYNKILLSNNYNNFKYKDTSNLKQNWLCDRCMFYKKLGKQAPLCFYCNDKTTIDIIRKLYIGYPNDKLKTNYLTWGHVQCLIKANDSKDIELLDYEHLLKRDQSLNLWLERNLNIINMKDNSNKLKSINYIIIDEGECEFDKEIDQEFLTFFKLNDIYNTIKSEIKIFSERYTLDEFLKTILYISYNKLKEITTDKNIYFKSSEIDLSIVLSCKINSADNNNSINNINKKENNKLNLFTKKLMTKYNLPTIISDYEFLKIFKSIFEKFNNNIDFKDVFYKDINSHDFLSIDTSETLDIFELS